MKRATGETFIYGIYTISFVIFCTVIIFRNIAVEYPVIFLPATMIAIIGLFQSAIFVTIKGI